MPSQKKTQRGHYLTPSWVRSQRDIVNKASGDSLVLHCASCSANAPNHACAFSGKGTVGFLLNEDCLIFFTVNLSQKKNAARRKPWSESIRSHNRSTQLCYQDHARTTRRGLWLYWGSTRWFFSPWQIRHTVLNLSELVQGFLFLLRFAWTDTVDTPFQNVSYSCNAYVPKRVEIISHFKSQSCMRWSMGLSLKKTSVLGPQSMDVFA